MGMSLLTEKIWGNEGKRIFNLKGAQAKILPYLLLVLIFGIFAMWCSDTFFQDTEPLTNTQEQVAAEDYTAELPSDASGYQRALETKLTHNLAQIDGVGQVTVTVSLLSGSEAVFAQNTSGEQRTIEEKADGGGTRVTNETKTTNEVVTLKNGTTPLVLEEKEPQIGGVMVIADGAADSGVKAMLMQAVATATGLPAHKIAVLPRRGN